MPEPIFALGLFAFVFTVGNNLFHEIKSRRNRKTPRS